MDRNETVYISNIQRFSIDDGPGIRTTVFLMGCNLKCLWCHNPECLTESSKIEIYEDRCTLCGQCSRICPQHVHSIEHNKHIINHSNCRNCGICETSCQNQALKIVGRILSVSDVMDVVRKDLAYYRKSGGGLTVSGGEPMLRKTYLLQLLEKSKHLGISTAIDTAGNVPFNWFSEVAPLTDVFLYDIKMFDRNGHELATGVDNSRILSNLVLLADAGTRLIVRVPVITTISSLSDLDRIAKFIAPLPIEVTQLLPYHSYGLSKYMRLGLKNRLTDIAPPAEGFMDEALSIFRSRGVNATIN